MRGGLWTLLFLRRTHKLWILRAKICLKYCVRDKLFNFYSLKSLTFFCRLLIFLWLLKTPTSCSQNIKINKKGHSIIVNNNDMVSKQNRISRFSDYGGNGKFVMSPNDVCGRQDRPSITLRISDKNGQKEKICSNRRRSCILFLNYL